MTALSSGLKARVLTVVMTVAVALGLVVATGTQEAAAANRDWLRADATGSCEWARACWSTTSCGKPAWSMRKS